MAETILWRYRSQLWSGTAVLAVTGSGDGGDGGGDGDGLGSSSGFGGNGGRAECSSISISGGSGSRGEGGTGRGDGDQGRGRHRRHVPRVKLLATSDLLCSELEAAGMQQTCVMVKPDAVRAGYTGAIVRALLANTNQGDGAATCRTCSDGGSGWSAFGAHVVASFGMQLTEAGAGEFYADYLRPNGVRSEMNERMNYDYVK